MSLFNGKPKFIYEFSEYSQFKNKEIYNPYDLVKHIIEEDNRFRRDYYEEDIIVSKVKNDLTGQIYYSDRIHLPQKEGFDWLEALLPFFTKKPIDYPLKNHVKKIQEDKISNKIDKQEEKTNIDRKEDKNEEINGEEDSTIQLFKSKLEKIEKSIKEKEEELEYLNEKIDNQENATVVKSENKSVINDSINNTTKSENVGIVEEDVQDAIYSTKTKFDHLLSQFIQEETTKIKSEIQRLDKRDTIADIITHRLKLEEKQQLEDLNKQLTDEKEQNLHKEKLRHQKNIQEIESYFINQVQEQKKRVQQEFKQKRESSIQEEYNKQTEQLSRILQGKMDELNILQQEMNAGLEENFKEVLDTFNQKHDQVIQEVERKNLFFESE